MAIIVLKVQSSPKTGVYRDLYHHEPSSQQITF